MAKYGVKPLSKAAMIHQLILIWNYLHRNDYSKDGSSDDENILLDTKNILPTSSTKVIENILPTSSTKVTKNILPTSTTEILKHSIKNPLQTSSDKNVCIKEFPELSDRTKRQIKDYIISKYYERIIRYEVNN